MTMGRIGKLEAFRKRFEEGSVRFFARHGVRLHGFFEIGEVPAEAVSEHSAGGIVWPAAGTRFGRDEVASATPSGGGSSPTPSGNALRAESEERHGAIVAEERTVILTPGACSPMQ